MHARRDVAAVDERADRLRDRTDRRCEARDLDQRGRERAPDAAAVARAAVGDVLGRRCPAPLQRARSTGGEQQIRRRAHREALEVVQGAPVAELVRHTCAEFLFVQRLQHRPRDQEPGTQHADESHQRRVRVDRERRHRRVGKRERPRHAHPLVGPALRASPGRHAASNGADHDGERNDGQRREADVESLDELTRLVPPVGRQEHERHECERESGRRQP